MIKFIVLMFTFSSLGACQTARSRSDYKPYRVVKKTEQKQRNLQRSKKKTTVKRQSKVKKSKRNRPKQFALYDSSDLDKRLLRRGKAARYSQALDLR